MRFSARFEHSNASNWSDYYYSFEGGLSSKIVVFVGTEGGLSSKIVVFVKIYCISKSEKFENFLEKIENLFGANLRLWY